MRRIVGFMVLFLIFAWSASAQDSAMYKSDDGLLTFAHPAAWELGEAAFDDAGYSVAFTLPDAEVRIQVVDVSDDSAEAFLSAQRKDSEGWVTEFAIGDFDAISSTLSSGDYQIAFALDETHVAVGVIAAKSSEIALGHEQAVVEVLASLQFGDAGTTGARIESPVLNIDLPPGWESASSQLQGDYFQFVLSPTDGGENYILIEILDLESRGLVETVQQNGVGTLMSQLPGGGDAEAETLTIGSFEASRAIGLNASTSKFTAYTLFVVQESWLVAISAAADTEIAARAMLSDVDAIIVEMEDGISLVQSALDEILKPTIEGVEYFPGLEALHEDGIVEYPQTPPAGGPHHPRWQTCGVYDAPIKNEHAVHSLEHGAVWITYQPDLPAEEIEALANLTRRGTHRLLSPYPGIDSPIILSAWGYQLKLESSDDPRLLEFLLQYEQGATTPELGATCAGGETRTAAELGQQ
jgi:Protein of unknown function (DUF3105)